MPGLSTEVLFGIDWIFQNKGIIDCVNRTIYLCECKLNAKSVSFENSEFNRVNKSIKMMYVNQTYWYNFSDTWNNAGRQLLHQMCNMTSAAINVMLGAVEKIFAGDRKN